MVGKLTFGKKQWEHLDSRMRAAIPPLHAAMGELLLVVDRWLLLLLGSLLLPRDTEAFSDYMEAMKLPKATEQEKTARQEAMQAGLKTAVSFHSCLKEKFYHLLL